MSNLETALDTLTLIRPDDWHVHLRDGGMLEAVLPATANVFGRAIVMPNLMPPILTAADVIRYRTEIHAASDEIGSTFEPLMTIAINDDTTPEIAIAAHKAGAVAGKIYPLGVTTNSAHGLRNFKSPQFLETLRAMQDIGMLLLIHGEIDRERLLVTQREVGFLPTFLDIVEEFLKLKIVLEHVSTKIGVDTVARQGPNVAATITAHHLCLTLNDVIGDGTHPHNMCMPVPKGYDDRDALIAAAISGNPKFFFGSDSAPHPKGRKECPKGACGVFSAPVIMPVLAKVFEKAGALDRLENFCSRSGAEFYELQVNTGTITMVRRPWTVPEEYAGIVPFLAGTEVEWSIIG